MSLTVIGIAVAVLLVAGVIGLIRHRLARVDEDARSRGHIVASYGPRGTRTYQSQQWAMHAAGVRVRRQVEAEQHYLEHLEAIQNESAAQEEVVR